MKRMLFIYNPMAGKEQIKNKLSDIVQIFCKSGFEITIFATQGPEDATNIVQERGEEYDYIVCSGGDGTMNEVDGFLKIPNRNNLYEYYKKTNLWLYSCRDGQ